MTRARLVLGAGLALSLALGACGKKDDAGDNKRPTPEVGGKTGPTSAGKTGPARKHLLPENTAVDLERLIDTETALPFGELKKIKLGMTRGEVEKLNPKLLDAMRGHVQDGVTYNAWAGGMMRKGDKNKFKIHTLNVAFYANFKAVSWHKVKERLDAKWGKPIDRPDFNLRGATSHFWFNPSVGVRAMLNGYDKKRATMGFAPRLKFQAYVPLAKWLGEPGKPFPFLVDGKPLLGMSAADVKRVYDYTPKKTSASTLPDMIRTEWDGDQPPSVAVWANDAGKVNYYTITLKYQHHPGGQAPFVAAIEAKYPGKKLTGDTWINVAPNVKVKHDKGWKAYKIEVGTK